MYQFRTVPGHITALEPFASCTTLLDKDNKRTGVRVQTDSRIDDVLDLDQLRRLRNEIDLFLTEGWN